MNKPTSHNQPHSRRRFLLASSALALGAGGFAVFNTPNKNSRSLLLGAIVDTIVPPGVSSATQKGAKDLAIDKNIEALAKKKPQFNAQLDRLVYNVNQAALKQYLQPFPFLNIDQREDLLNALITHRERQQLRMDLSIVRNTVLDLYFTSSEGHKMLDYTLPAHNPNY